MPSTIGIIYPPPEVRSIVDKTATFVARNGPEFEEKIRANEISNTKFNFLNVNDPYHAYYQHKVREIASGVSDKKTPEEEKEKNTEKENEGEKKAESSDVTSGEKLEKMNLSSRTQDTQSKIMEQMIILKDPPPDFEFIVDAPSIMPLDIDVIKLTAQFVARNGRPFLSNLMNKEQRNPIFDFLKPQHSHFTYFTRLVDQYTKVLLPPRDLMAKMRAEVAKPFQVLKDMSYRVEWNKQQLKEKERAEEAAEKERIAYAQIDWHDFVVVETVDFQPGETGNFPPPTTPQDVGARVVAQERFDSGEANMIDINGRILIDRIIEDESRVAVESGETTSKSKLKSGGEVDRNVDEVAMDEESDEEKEKKDREATETAAAVAKQASKQQQVAAALPPNPENVIIRKDYDPKQKAKEKEKSEDTTSSISKSEAGPEAYFKSPLTGELIPESSLSEHMRISMLDPRWLEQRQKERKEREEKEDVLTSDVSIEHNLKRLAQYRSDVFGRGAEEVVIGRKMGSAAEELAQQQAQQEAAAALEAETEAEAEAEVAAAQAAEAVAAIEASKNTTTTTSTAAAEEAAQRGAISAEDQMNAIHHHHQQNQGIQQQQQQQQQQHQPPRHQVPSHHPHLQSHPPHHQTIVSDYKLLNIPANKFIPPPPGQAQGQLAPPSQSIQPPPPHLMQQQQPRQSAEVSLMEPASKKLKTMEESLMPESEYLEKFGSAGPVTFKIAVPNAPEKPEWNLNGQTLEMSFALSENVSVIKSKLLEVLTIPASKQKLQLDTIFIKDTNTLAYYNVSNNTTIQLQLKERGGRKK